MLTLDFGGQQVDSTVMHASSLPYFLFYMHACLVASLRTVFKFLKTIIITILYHTRHVQLDRSLHPSEHAHC
jgi:hypothetical protein